MKSYGKKKLHNFCCTKIAICILPLNFSKIKRNKAMPKECVTNQIPFNCTAHHPLFLSSIVQKQLQNNVFKKQVVVLLSKQISE